MSLFQLFLESFRNKEATSDKPELLFEVLEVEHSLCRRLHRSKLLKHSELPVEGRRLAIEIGCSAITWKSLTREQKHDFISTAMQTIQKKPEVIFVKHAGVKMGAETSDKDIVDHYAKSNITRVLVDDELLDFSDFISFNTTPQPVMENSRN